MLHDSRILFQGHPIWTVRHSVPIRCLISVNLTPQNLSGYILSLTDGTFQLYKEQHVCDDIFTWSKVSKIQNKAQIRVDGDAAPPPPTDWAPIEPDPIVVGVFGRYDRESGALGVMTKSEFSCFPCIRFLILFKKT